MERVYKKKIGTKEFLSFNPSVTKYYADDTVKFSVQTSQYLEAVGCENVIDAPLPKWPVYLSFSKKDWYVVKSMELESENGYVELVAKPIDFETLLLRLDEKGVDFNIFTRCTKPHDPTLYVHKEDEGHFDTTEDTYIDYDDDDEDDYSQIGHDEF